MLRNCVFDKTQYKHLHFPKYTQRRAVRVSSVASEGSPDVGIDRAGKSSIDFVVAGEIISSRARRCAFLIASGWKSLFSPATSM